VSSSRFSATLSHFFLRWLPISDNFVIAIVTFCLIPAKCAWLRADLTIDSFWRKAAAHRNVRCRMPHRGGAAVQGGKPSETRWIIDEPHHGKLRPLRASPPTTGSIKSSTPAGRGGRKRMARLWPILRAVFSGYLTNDAEPRRGHRVLNVAGACASRVCVQRWLKDVYHPGETA
jgi:hypothetical protein